METTPTTTKTKWAIDPSHSEIGFQVKHLMITNVKGSFKSFDGTISSSEEDWCSSRIEVNIDAASVTTRDEQRDGHLRSADFFDAEKYPKITFTATTIEKKDNKNFKLNGNLNIRGISKPVSLDVVIEGVMKDPWGNRKAGFTVNGKIHRKDWGLNWNAALEAGGLLVSDEVQIVCDVQLIQQKETA